MKLRPIFIVTLITVIYCQTNYSLRMPTWLSRMNTKPLQAADFILDQAKGNRGINLNLTAQMQARLTAANAQAKLLIPKESSFLSTLAFATASAFIPDMYYRIRNRFFPSAHEIERFQNERMLYLSKAIEREEDAAKQARESLKTCPPGDLSAEQQKAKEFLENDLKETEARLPLLKKERNALEKKLLTLHKNDSSTNLLH